MDYPLEANAIRIIDARKILGLPKTVKLPYSKYHLRIYRDPEDRNSFFCRLALLGVKDDEGYVKELEFFDRCRKREPESINDDPRYSELRYDPEEDAYVNICPDVPDYEQNDDFFDTYTALCANLTPQEIADNASFKYDLVIDPERKQSYLWLVVSISGTAFSGSTLILECDNHPSKLV